MRINPHIQVEQMYNTKKPGNVKKAESAARADGVMISNIGKEIQTAKQAVAEGVAIAAIRSTSLAEKD